MRRCLGSTVVGLLLFGAAAAGAADFKENVFVLRNYHDYAEAQVIAAIEQLAAAQDKRAIGPLSELLDIGASRERISTAARQALLELGAMEVFAQKLRSGPLQERQQTAQQLSRMGSPAVDLLVPLLNDPAPELRDSVVASLGVLARGTGDARAVEALVQALRDTSPYVQESAVLALGSLGSTQGLAALADLLRKGQLVPQVVGALTRIVQAKPESAEPIVQSLGPLLEDQDAAVVERAVQVLRGLQAVAARDALLRLLQHPSARIRYAVVRALVPYRDEPAVRSAVEALAAAETDSLVRQTSSSFLAGELNVDQ